ncbi:hypothetical protein [Microvirga subterranea]|uniref:Beta-barrel assembly machine subunit BamE n=1 Tax=Microvirga subterranea TaxID=186651 RepID=A0A370HP68_9HYPH|nr:hypothetical protein [Microvirga subterranea]RDI60237.1 hypothetical protein DES45_103499 [Microvirga subterranea]
MRVRVVSCLALLTLGLAACNSSRTEAPVVAAASPMAAPMSAPGPSIVGPVLGSDGRCTGTAAGAATSIEPGITECDLVRLKGKPATDVLVGESGKGQREVQVLYSEPGGRELYFFVNNRLDRVVK